MYFLMLELIGELESQSYESLEDLEGSWLADRSNLLFGCLQGYKGTELQELGAYLDFSGKPVQDSDWIQLLALRSKENFRFYSQFMCSIWIPRQDLANAYFKNCRIVFEQA